VIYRFADFSLNSDTRQLLAGERECHLSPKAFDLLLALIEQRSRALSKTELTSQLWPSTFVGETNLPTLVAEVRRALGDSAQDSTFVRTVHRFGYRFVADVALAPAAHAGSAPEPLMYLATPDARYPLAPGTLIIGRARDAGIRIDAGGVSRHHARIVITPGDVRVEDLGSKNGTFVNGKPVVGSQRLANGSEVRVGPVAFTYVVASPTMPTETMGPMTPGPGHDRNKP
jgi:DNA-binding winged helix-turn-helix (wHTH) protein